MAKHQRRTKLTNTHTTYIPAAYELREYIRRFGEVTRIAAGIIRPGLHAVPKRVKIVDDSGAVLLKVRGSTSLQEIRIYTTDRQKTKLAIARGARDLGFGISFTKEVD